MQQVLSRNPLKHRKKVNKSTQTDLAQNKLDGYTLTCWAVVTIVAQVHRVMTLYLAQHNSVTAISSHNSCSRYPYSDPEQTSELGRLTERIANCLYRPRKMPNKRPSLIDVLLLFVGDPVTQAPPTRSPITVPPRPLRVYVDPLVQRVDQGGSTSFKCTAIGGTGRVTLSWTPSVSISHMPYGTSDQGDVVASWIAYWALHQGCLVQFPV